MESSLSDEIPLQHPVPLRLFPGYLATLGGQR